MLPHPTLDKLQTLRLHGMLKALNEQLKTPDIDSLSFEERLGLLVDRELTERDDKRLSSRLRQARLKHNACIEDIDYRSPRGLDKALILQLSGGQWLRDGLNLIIGGPTGVGKTWLACTLAHQACRAGYRVRYLRLLRTSATCTAAIGFGVLLGCATWPHAVSAPRSRRSSSRRRRSRRRSSRPDPGVP